MSYRYVIDMDGEQNFDVFFGPYETVDALRRRLCEIQASYKTATEVRKATGRPMKGANHPFHTPAEMKSFRDLLFSVLNISKDENFRVEETGQRPTCFADYQDDMLENFVRLDNGLLANFMPFIAPDHWVCVEKLPDNDEGEFIDVADGN